MHKEPTEAIALPKVPRRRRRINFKFQNRTSLIGACLESIYGNVEATPSLLSRLMDIAPHPDIFLTLLATISCMAMLPKTSATSIACTCKAFITHKPSTGLSCCSAILGEIHCKEPFYKVWSNIIYWNEVSKKYRLHLYRHTFITLSIKKGTSPIMLKYITGWKPTKMPDRYPTSKRREKSPATASSNGAIARWFGSAKNEAAPRKQSRQKAALAAEAAHLGENLPDDVAIKITHLIWPPGMYLSREDAMNCNHFVTIL